MDENVLTLLLVMITVVDENDLTLLLVTITAVPKKGHDYTRKEQGKN